MISPPKSGLSFGINNYAKEIIVRFEDKSLKEILAGMEEEAAKAISIIRCAQDDIKTAETKLRFITATIHYLKQRYGDIK